MQPIYWLILMVICLVIEVFTLGLTSIWFAGGALVAFVVALPGTPVPVQAGVFVAVSILLLFFTRPLAARYLNSRTKKTNVDSLQGQSALVVEAIDNRLAQGRVQVNGVDWTARTVNGEPVEAGAEVVIREIQGVKLMVERKEQA